jgi:hypothetical protein
MTDAPKPTFSNATNQQSNATNQQLTLNDSNALDNELAL